VVVESSGRACGHSSIVGGDITSKQNLEYNLRHGVKHPSKAAFPEKN